MTHTTVYDINAPACQKPHTGSQGRSEWLYSYKHYKGVPQHVAEDKSIAIYPQEGKHVKV